MTIDPKKFYSLGEIVGLELIPGIDTTQKASNLVKNDKMNNGVLCATPLKSAGGTIRYRVRGANIIKYLANLDDQKD